MTKCSRVVLLISPDYLPGKRADCSYPLAEDNSSMLEHGLALLDDNCFIAAKEEKK